jgi:hypothetical protein
VPFETPASGELRRKLLDNLNRGVTGGSRKVSLSCRELFLGDFRATCDDRMSTLPAHQPAWLPELWLRPRQSDQQNPAVPFRLHHYDVTLFDASLLPGLGWNHHLAPSMDSRNHASQIRIDVRNCGCGSFRVPRIIPSGGYRYFHGVAY